MKEIALSSGGDGLVAIVDDAAYEALAAKSWRAKKNACGVYYACRQEGSKTARRTIYMHRQVLGVTVRSVEVDHIDGNTLDNRRANLRSCTHGENRCNNHRRKSGYSSRFKGVWWDTARCLWCAATKLNRKRFPLGRFDDERAAAEAYNAAALRLHGAFACLNRLPTSTERSPR